MEWLLSSQPWPLLALATLLYAIGGAVYRLYFSPVAGFPGPRLAALTFLYEFYYDFFLQGRYSWKIQQLHTRYGPVVRINPGELHVNDPACYHVIYVGPSRRTEKWSYSARMFGTPLAAVGTTSHELHRMRRSALNAFFSKKAIAELEPVVQGLVNHACSLLTERGSNRTALNLEHFFAAFTADSIGEIAVGSKYGLLDRPGFEPGWQALMMDLSRATHLMKQLPWAYTIVKLLPPQLPGLVYPLFKRLFDIRNDICRKIKQSKTSLNETAVLEKSVGAKNHSTIIQTLLSSNKLNDNELQTTRLEDEVFTLVGAGTITTAQTLTLILYHVLASPIIKAQLESELNRVYSTLPDSALRPGLKELEHCPYLSAIVSEGLRLSFGVSHRLPRISPDAPLQLQGSTEGKPYDYTIPPGVPVSMTQMFIHLDSTIYHSPRTFDPQRWLTSASATEDEKEELKRRTNFLVPFSRGTRMCAGMHLAYAEIYLMLGSLFAPAGVGRRMELFETGIEDVECRHDFFNPSPRLDSKGVRVILT